MSSPIKISIDESYLYGEDLYESGKILKRDFIKVAKQIDKLRYEIQEGNIHTVPLQGNQPRTLAEDIVFYEIKPDHSAFYLYTSHYIGFFQNDVVHIEIKPRLFCSENNNEDREKLFYHLIDYATNIYIPPSKTETSLFDSEYFSILLLTLLWKGALEHALTHNFIPKSYIRYQGNLRFLRGRIDFTRHLRKNLIDQSHFYCSYQELTFDVTVNRTIRHICDLVYQDKSLSPILGDLSGHEEKLASFGVQNRTTISKIEAITYNRMNEEYRRAMTLSKQFLLRQGISESGQKSEQHNPYCFFIDLAELWENYLLKILQYHLSKEYRVYSPNFEPNEIYMLQNEDEDRRLIRPDIIIEDHSTQRVVAVLDAKYKNYQEFGKHAKNERNPHRVSKDDFYQMNTFLLHYQKQQNKDTKLTGLFISPSLIKNADPRTDIIACDINTYKSYPNLKIGIVNLPFKQLLNHWDNKNELHKKFCSKIEEIIT